MAQGREIFDQVRIFPKSNETQGRSTFHLGFIVPGYGIIYYYKYSQQIIKIRVY